MPGGAGVKSLLTAAKMACAIENRNALEREKLRRYIILSKILVFFAVTGPPFCVRLGVDG
jgi:membrane protein YqaA with SNARE-associated domain